MATPRKKIKIRDKEATIARLIEMVGVILRENGYRWLNPSEIQKKLGKNRRQVYTYFLNMNNLLSAYLREKDYWLPYFERFQLREDAGAEELRNMFVNMMQENLSFFKDDNEMQSIILWQLSESRAILKELNFQREEAGAKRLVLTDEFFEGTDVDFRSLMALILGGSYFISLHSRMNIGTVAGRDIRNPADLALMQKTIEQLIKWAFHTALEHNKNKIKSSTIMDFELANLHRIAAKLSDKEHPAGRDSLSRELNEEVQRLQWVMLKHISQLSNETQLKTYVQISFSTLIKICDLLYEPGSDNTGARLLLDLMETIRSAVPDYIPGGLVLPKLFRKEQGEVFLQEWSDLAEQLRAASVKPELIEIATFPYTRFTEAKGLMHWVDFKYLKLYTKVIRDLTLRQSFGTSDLAEVLVGLGFNHTRFLSWYSKYIQDGLAVLAYKDVKRILSRHKAQLRQLVIYTDLLFHHYKLSPTQQLSNWIDAERTFQMENAPNAPFNPSAIQTDLADLQILWWQQFQQKHGIYNEPDQSTLIRKTVFNFRNLERKEIDELSLTLDPRESNFIQPFEAILQNMLEEVRNMI
ncbi:TetR/AcrR family transcriptional regulator [Pedobacter chinensis]|uniref:TetR/AcrR family transcriptional regulator n=1 Tax=Pedobacter chinensis TaxID=2282421 RepID=A0A369Q2V8_9SPHI|nr:TetR/AcrR family transcriptional regulator [Pedobacter chinensis]RDC56648.1 TetR/AcrR family transcriptional regulator [Pedobacter chinensis]